MKIGLFGGAFDPVTLSHIRVAKEVLHQVDVDTIWLLPCYISRYNKKMVDCELRCAMVKLATEPYIGIDLCDWELINQASGKTYDLLNRIKNDYPDYHFQLIIGQDTVAKMSDWYNWEALRRENTFIIVPRLGAEPLPDDFKKRDILIHMVPDDVSSTKAREAIARGEEPFDLIDHQVLRFIKEKNLYIKPGSSNR